MKKLILPLFLFAAMSATAQTTIAEVFKQMPDSLLPYLSKNNRLDMIDFMEAGMKAEVTNLLDGTSTMNTLSSDSLSIKMNDCMTVTLRLVERDSTVVEMRQTYKISEDQEQTVVRYYSTSWYPLTKKSVLHSSLLRRDDDVFSRRHF